VASCGLDASAEENQWQGLVYTVINLRVPYNAGNFLSSSVAISF
jgi:hypothetical protein